MPNYGRFENGKVYETAVFDSIEGRFPPKELVPSMDWREVPDECVEGWLDFGGQAVPPDHIALLHDRIDIAAGKARARYITVAPGQEVTYMLKGQQAEAFKAAGYQGTVPAMVEAEANAVGCTAQEATDDILSQQAAWVVKCAQIEQTRRSWKLTVSTSADPLADTIEAETELGEL